MVTTIAKRIQSRLSRQGLKVSLGDIRPVYSELVTDTDNPTAEEVEAIFNYFMNNATKLAVIAEEETTGNEESDNLETVHNLSTSVDNNLDNALDNKDGLETATNNGLDTQSVVKQDEQQGGAIAPVATSELVASTAESMGITLNLEDISAIASNFDQASTNSDSELEEIRDAIVSFVQHKSQITQQKISNIVEEVRDKIHHLDAENSQHLNDGLRSISEDIKSGSERFRNQTRQALKVFALPPTKAG